MGMSDFQEPALKKEKKTSKSKELISPLVSGIKVSVRVVPAEKDSNIENNSFAFAYTVTIQNHTQVTCQLINRHWKVFSGDIQIADVKGEGVVGQQPVLRPMDSFEYTSWTLVNDPVGKMMGSFTFQSEEGDFFDVEIPSFELIFRNRSNVH
jgi:ApaG protein